MEATEDKGKILLSGFSLEPAEKAIVDNLVRNYQHKLEEKTTYDQIKIRMRKQQKGKTFLHSVQGEMFAGKIFTAKAEDYNLFSALSDVFEKLMHEAEHKKRTSRQTK